AQIQDMLSVARPRIHALTLNPGGGAVFGLCIRNLLMSLLCQVVDVKLTPSGCIVDIRQIATIWRKFRLENRSLFVTYQRFVGSNGGYALFVIIHCNQAELCAIPGHQWMIPYDIGDMLSLWMPGGLHDKIRAECQFCGPHAASRIDNRQSILIFVSMDVDQPFAIC